MTEIDMGALNRWLDQVRDTFINASELAEKVANLSRQVDEMSRTLNGLQNTNRVLEENLAWSRTERDRLETANREAVTKANMLESDLANTQRDRDYWRGLAEQRAAQIVDLRKENDQVTSDFMKADDELTAVKEKLNAVGAALGILQQPTMKPVEVPKVEPVPVPVPVPPVESVNHTQQPRNPVTQQWESPYKEDAQQDEHPVQRTGTYHDPF